MAETNAASAKNVSIAIYRYVPGRDSKPYMKNYQIEVGHDLMLLDALLQLKQEDPSLAFRRSCKEGVCGSDAMNVNGKNILACITPISNLGKKIIIRPLPGFPVIRDLVVDMTPFYNQYYKIEPWLHEDERMPAPAKERLQSPQERAKLDGLYECILCACCTSSCPSYWWNPDKFIGPAGLLQAYRFIADSRDGKKRERLEKLGDPYSIFRCRGIMNCVDVCPKGLNPTKAIAGIRKELLEEGI